MVTEAPPPTASGSSNLGRKNFRVTPAQQSGIQTGLGLLSSVPHFCLGSVKHSQELRQELSLQAVPPVASLLALPPVGAASEQVLDSKT